MDLPEEDTRPAVLVDTDHARELREEAAQSWDGATEEAAPQTSGEVDQ